MKAFKRILTALLCLPLALPLLARGAEPEPALLTRLDALDRVPALAGLTTVLSGSARLGLVGLLKKPR